MAPKISRAGSCWHKTLLTLTILIASTGAQAITFECTRQDEVLRYRLVPGCEGQHYSETYGALKFQVNKAGLVMGYDPTPIPAKNTYRILILGASFTANINEKIGINQPLTEALNKGNLKNNQGQPIRFEIVNASIPGYHPIQLHIILPELIEAYHPHLIVLDQYYPARMVSLLFDHESAEEIDQQTGLVKKLGIGQDFWPLPSSLNYLLWRLETETAQKIRVAIKALRMTFFKSQVYFKSLGTDQEPSAYIKLHIKYLDAINNVAIKHDIPLVLMHWISSDFDIDNFMKGALEKELWFDLENRMLRIPPYGLINRKDVIFQDEEIRRKFSFIDLTKLHFSGDELLANDLHLAQPGFTRLAKAMANRLMPLIKSQLRISQPSSAARQ